jgi:hypothetical protein
MTLVLELPPELRERLHHFAVSRGLSDEGALVQLVAALPEQSESADPLPPRVPGLGEGNVFYMAPDFNATVPDEVWAKNKE